MLSALCIPNNVMNIFYKWFVVARKLKQQESIIEENLFAVILQHKFSFVLSLKQQLFKQIRKFIRTTLVCFPPFSRRSVISPRLISLFSKLHKSVLKKEHNTAIMCSHNPLTIWYSVVNALHSFHGKFR